MTFCSDWVEGRNRNKIIERIVIDNTLDTKYIKALLLQQRENCVKEYESYYAGSKEDFAPQCVIDSIRNAAEPIITKFHCNHCSRPMAVTALEYKSNSYCNECFEERAAENELAKNTFKFMGDEFNLD
jgi:hypothetical protein